MMRRSDRFTIPITLFVVVFAVSQLTMRYTFILQENLSLYLHTPDYYREVFAGKWPLVTLMSDWLLQFYRFPCVGALLTATYVTVIYLMFRYAIRRLSFGASAPLAALRASLAWVVIAMSPTLRPAIVAMAGAFGLGLVAVFFKSRLLSGRRVISSSLVGASIAIAAGIVMFSPKIIRNERWAKVEVCTRQHQWDKVLDAATPRAVQKDREMLPFALLALSMQDRLDEQMIMYPVQDASDLDMTGEKTRRGYFFQSIMYECLGSQNEAIHCIFQSGCSLPHGTSFMVLRQLVKYNLSLKDYALARKYCEVLAQSPANRSMARRMLAQMPAAEAPVKTANDSDKSLLITNNPIDNIVKIGALGGDSRLLEERFRAYQQLAK